jgi:hypothetical protein
VYKKAILIFSAVILLSSLYRIHGASALLDPVSVNAEGLVVGISVIVIVSAGLAVYFGKRKPMSKVFSAFLIVVLLVSALSGVALAVLGAEIPVTLSSPVELQTNLTGEMGCCVFQLADGSLVLNTANQSCTFLIKLDSSNHVLWTRTIRIGQEITNLTRLLPTSDGGFALAGLVDNMYVLVKTDSQGNIQWTKMFSSGAPINYFMSIIQTSDGGFAIAGFGEKVLEGLGAIWFAKTNSSGNLEWNETLSGQVAACPSTIIQTPDGGYIMSDVSYSFVPIQGFFTLTKMNATGDVLWSKNYGGEGYYFQPECNYVITTKGGGYLMAGYLWDKCAWVVKTDAEGNMQWNQTYGAKDSSITCALETQSGGYMLLAISNLTDVGLIMIDKVGNELWNMTFPGVTLPWGLEANYNSLIPAKDGGYIVVGSKNQSVWLAKLNYQDNRSIALQLLSIADVALAVAAIMTLLIAPRKKKTIRRSTDLKQAAY